MTEALRGGDRKAWDKRLAWLKREGAEGELRPAASEIASGYRAFCADVEKDEAELIANPLLWNDQETAFGLWVEGAFHDFSRAASSALKRFAELPAPGSPDAAAMAAVALAASTASLKWAEVAGSGRRTASVAEIHRAFRLASELGLRDAAPALPAGGGRDVSISVTAHYARALMLESFCRGNLGRQQVAVLDAWLWEWSPAYHLSDGPVTGALLAVDAGGTRGLRALADGENLQGLVLVIEPMAQQIEAVVREFHAGRIFPGHGLATTFRVEVHVALLDTLRAFLAVARKGLALRQRREGCEAQVEVLVGLTEILAKATNAPVRFGGYPTIGIESQYEVPRRLLRLVDESDSGLGLEGDDGVQPLEVGTLLGLRREDGEVLLGEVARRVAQPGSPTRFGVRLLSRALHRLELSRGKDHAQALYLAGEDSSGRQDAVLIGQGDFDPLADYDIRLADRAYRVQLNRVRYQGRGWLLAGVEVVEERAESAPLTLALAD